MLDIQEILALLVHRVTMIQLPVVEHLLALHAQLIVKLVLLQAVLLALMDISILILVIPSLFAMDVLLLAIS